jgi:Mg-chelatase subunit ChlI
VDGHRGDLVILKTARAHAAFEGRGQINDRDIALAAELALPHRIRRGPFYQSEISMEDLQERIEQLHGAQSSEVQPEPIPDQETTDQKKKR